MSPNLKRARPIGVGRSLPSPFGHYYRTRVPVNGTLLLVAGDFRRVLGPPPHFSYTAMDVPVNLASRLEDRFRRIGEEAGEFASKPYI
jgi:hypothetical protein